MSNCLNGLSTINIELTSRCNKNCWMCGRRKIDKDYPNISLDYGDMDFSLLEKIEHDTPEDIVIQFHNNGEPLLYPKLKSALELFKNRIRCFNTNGKLLIEKSDEIINNLETITISVIENDPEGDEQFNIVNKFIEIKGDKKPYIIYRCLGNVNVDRWSKLGGLIVTRVLHNPLGSYGYQKITTKPEVGVCLDLLHHLYINRFGKVSTCVRFDPNGYGVIGDLNKETLYNIWNGSLRKDYIDCHLSGNRNKKQLCSKCDYWGLPRGN